MNKSGHIYVADLNNHRIQVFTSTGEYITQWGSQGTGNGQFQNPTGIAINSISGEVYVVEYENHRIQLFTSTGVYLTQWGSQGSGDGQFQHPRGIALNASGYVYIGDTENNRVQVFSPFGEYQFQWGSLGNDSGLFNRADGIAIYRSEYVLVSDLYNHRIQVFSSTGEYITKWGSEGSESGQFSYPCGLAINNSGYLYVVEIYNHRIQVHHINFPISSYNMFMSRWDTTQPGSANNQIALPIYSGGTYDITIDWGDGNTEQITDYSQNMHTYSIPGIYDVNITGNINGWQFNNSGDRLKLLEISQWGCLRLGNLGSYFYGCENLNLTATDALDLTATTTLYQTFLNCTNLGCQGNMNGWDVSKVTNMNSMFSGASTFNQPIGNWDVSQVKHMEYIFLGATAFNQPIGTWNVSSVTTMEMMFTDAAAFNQPIGTWNVSKVTNMHLMFSGASTFNQPIGNWDVSQVTDMAFMFVGATSFNQPLGAWNVSKVSIMNLMFLDVTLSTINYDNLLIGWSQLDLQSGIFFDGGNSKYSQNAVAARNILTSSPNSWSITDGGFVDTTAFLSHWDTSQAGSANNQIALPIYSGGIYDFTIDWGDGNTEQITDYTQNTHTYATSGIYDVNITGTIVGWQFNNGGDRLKLLEISQWGCLQLGNLGSYFYGCENLNLTATDALDLNGTTSLSQAFRDCVNLGSHGNMNGWHVSSVTTMAGMFYNATAFNQPIGNWDVSSVTNMESMFQYAAAFNQSIGNWNVSSVTTMFLMFERATAFNQPIGNWDVSSVTKMSNIFNGVTLSPQNYDHLLLGWSQLTLQPNVIFSGGNSKYSQNAVQARSILTSSPNSWIITDGGYLDLSPPAPTLNSITPNPSQTGNITLMWNAVTGATMYYIYRNTSIIISTIGLSPITGFAENVYYDIGLLNSTYYYAIIASNASGNSSLSNCVNVTVAIPPNPTYSPTAPLVEWITPNPSATGNISLTWNNVDGATHYYLYRETAPFTDTSGLTPLANVSTTTYFDLGLFNNFYHYGVVASNSSGNSSLSNVVNVTVEIPASPIYFPETPVLHPITPNPSSTGNITLTWDVVPDAGQYFIYRDTQNITTLVNLSAIAYTTNTTYLDLGLGNGTYFYTIIAINASGNSSMSNVESVTVTFPAIEPIPLSLWLISPANNSVYQDLFEIPLIFEIHGDGSLLTYWYQLNYDEWVEIEENSTISLHNHGKQQIQLKGLTNLNQNISSLIHTFYINLSQNFDSELEISASTKAKNFIKGRGNTYVKVVITIKNKGSTPISNLTINFLPEYPQYKLKNPYEQSKTYESIAPGKDESFELTIQIFETLETLKLTGNISTNEFDITFELEIKPQEKSTLNFGWMIGGAVIVVTAIVGFKLIKGRKRGPSSNTTDDDSMNIDFIMPSEFEKGNLRGKR